MEPTEGAGGGWRVVLRRCVLGAIGLLYLVSIPWYRTTGEIPPLLFGLPDWVAVALACYLGVAVLNAVAWTLTEVSDGDSPEGKDRP